MVAPTFENTGTSADRYAVQTLKKFSHTSLIPHAKGRVFTDRVSKAMRRVYNALADIAEAEQYDRDNIAKAYIAIRNLSTIYAGNDAFDNGSTPEYYETLYTIRMAENQFHNALFGTQPDVIGWYLFNRLH